MDDGDVLKEIDKEYEAAEGKDMWVAINEEIERHEQADEG